MSYLLDKAFQVTLMVIFLLLFVVFAIIGFFLMSKVKKKNRKEQDEYYQELNRYDAQDYLDFDDITDEMVIMNNHRRFVGAIKTIGYDFYSASSTQQASTMNGYMEFLRSITTPVTYRQYYVRMSMEHTQSMYAKRYEEIERELFHKNADRLNIVEKLNTVRGNNLVAEEYLLNEAENLQKEISNLEWRRMHMKEQMDFMDLVCDETTMEPDIEQVYTFEWEFYPNQYNIEMTEEEIHKKAIEEMNGIARRLINGLGNANVRAYRCSTAELIEMFYSQSHPVSAMEFKMPDVVNSPYFDFIATTNDFENKKENAYKDAMLSEGMRLAEVLEDIELEDEAEEVIS